MRIVNEAVEDAVGDGGIADLIVPVSQGNLTGQDSGAGGVTVVADFQEVAALRVGQRSHRPIIHDQHVDAGDPVQKFSEAAVDAGDGEIAQQAWGASIESGEAIADGFLRQSAGQKAFPDTGRASPIIPTFRITPPCATGGIPCSDILCV